MVVMALALMLASPAVVLEQKTSALQRRATSAFEVAEAGLAWTLTRLNDHTAIDPNSNTTCAASAQPAGKPFRHWYAPAAISADFLRHNLTPVPNTRVACGMHDNGSLSCHCPAPGAPVSLAVAAAESRTFTVTIEPEPLDRDALRLTSLGCVNAQGPCSEAQRRSGDATARISLLVKRVNRLISIPNAPVTSSDWVQVCDTVTLANHAAQSGGRLAHAGGAIRLGAAQSSGALPAHALPCPTPNATLAGPVAALTPDVAAPHDARLMALAVDSSALMQAFLGESLAPYQEGACRVTGNSPSDRGRNLHAAYQRVLHPCRHFWVEGDLQLDGVTLGAATTPLRPAQPVLLAVSGHVSLGAGTQLHGLLHLTGPNDQLRMTGSFIHGAVVARGPLRLDGTGGIRYLLDTLSALAASGPFVRVPGSWSDDE